MMRPGKIHSLKKVVFQLVLLALPTTVFACFLLWRLNNYYTILENDWLWQALYFGSGCAGSLIVYRYRFRFGSTALLLFLLNLLIYRMLQSINFGEFDSFFVSVRFYIFFILFTTGWIAGYAFSRSKYLTIAWGTLLLMAQIVLVTKTSTITANALIAGIAPGLAYAFYIIYTAGFIRHVNEDEQKLSILVAKRLGLFALIVFLLFLGILQLFHGNFKAIEKEWGGAKANEHKEGNGKGGESMTQDGKNGGVENKDQSKLSGSLSKDKQLLFVARLDHFFGNTNIPNPLYFTNRYYTKFDTATQTFETDPAMPYNDLFSPDPSKIPLYHQETDDAVIRQSLATLNRKVVSTEVYNVNLSPETYLAPSTAFSCKPVSVPKEFKKQYRSAYQAKMWVSELNSAYFIYNPAGNAELENFQEARFEKLRTVKHIEGPDKIFMDYYTYMPANADYQRIGQLAREVTAGAETPIDQIIAIRDYFLSKDEFNQPLFRYSDNPGIPGMPSASKLNYFLFENRKGYCAYFAGATLFMLRSLGIPSRVAAGFSTTDRSSKNPGWYWFYQDQAHAWVQVYFQGYGWIDFDTTIPDLNTQQASQPDGTPPTDVPATYLVADGEIVSLDTVKKTLTISTAKILYHDSEFVSTRVLQLKTDASLASISADTNELRFNNLEKGMLVTAISHAEALKTIFTKPNDSMASVIARLPDPVPIDEIKVHKKEDKKDARQPETKRQASETDWLSVLYGLLFGLIGIGILLVLSPAVVWWWYRAKANKTYTDLAEKGFYVNRAIHYYLHQMGYAFHQASPETYAAQIDSQFGTSLVAFQAAYQKAKYRPSLVTDNERETILHFQAHFISQIKTAMPLKRRLKHFVNLYRTLHYFSKPKLS